MPPKKKKGGKKKKKAQDGELTIEDKYKKTMEEIEALKDQLTIRKELSRRSHTQADDWKGRMEEMEQHLTTNTDDQRAVSADMTRQYKTMQTEMGLRIHTLEHELARTRAQLEHTQSELKSTQDERDKLVKDKDNEIAALTLKIQNMGLQYDSLLNEALDRLIEKISDATVKWEGVSSMVQSRNKQVLLEFGLNPLDL